MTNDSLRAHLGIQWEILDGKVVPIMDTKNVQLGSVECENNYMHTGSSIVLTPVVKDRTGKLLTKDVDYSISYSPSYQRLHYDHQRYRRIPWQADV